MKQCPVKQPLGDQGRPERQKQGGRLSDLSLRSSLRSSSRVDSHSPSSSEAVCDLEALKWPEPQTSGPCPKAPQFDAPNVWTCRHIDHIELLGFEPFLTLKCLSQLDFNCLKHSIGWTPIEVPMLRIIHICRAEISEPKDVEDVKVVIRKLPLHNVVAPLATSTDISCHHSHIHSV